jgi:hypothetical protein
MARSHRCASVALLASLLGACAHDARRAPAASPVGSTSYRSSAGADLAHYQLALGQVAMGATPLSDPAPVYPPTMLAACPASVELPARVIVNAQGGVSDVRIDAASQATRQPFAIAVRTAVHAWRFQPLQITRWAAAGDGTTHPVDSDARPFTLDYVFTFRCEQGRASVSSGAAPGLR